MVSGGMDAPGYTSDGVHPTLRIMCWLVDNRW